MKVMFKCLWKNCEKILSTSSGIQRHIRTIHLGYVSIRVTQLALWWQASKENNIDYFPTVVHITVLDILVCPEKGQTMNGHQGVVCLHYIALYHLVRTNKRSTVDNFSDVTGQMYHSTPCWKWECVSSDRGQSASGMMHHIFNQMDGQACKGSHQDAVWEEYKPMKSVMLG